MQDVIEKLLSLNTYAEELGINLDTEQGRFKWFLASILFAKRISAEIAKKTYFKFEKSGIVDPESLIQAGWDRLVEVLDSGSYVRYDFSTATNLLEIAAHLKEKYGTLDNLYAQSEDGRDLEKRLIEFKGVGPVTVNIFLRELKGVWEKAKPCLSAQAKEIAPRLGLSKEQMELPNVESVLVRLNIEFCKHKKCGRCPVKEECQVAQST
jgi:endonuclease III